MKSLILAVILISPFSFSFGEPSERVLSLLMSKIPVKNIAEDSYLCTAVKTNDKESEYITEFKPNALNPSVIHHMLIYGCESLIEPKGQTEGYVWKCGDMPYHSCNPTGRTQTLYSWSKNASTFTLPEGIGFKVGGDTKLNYLALQVHYFKVDQIKSPDDSGFFLKMVPKSFNKISKSAGVLSLESDWTEDKKAIVPKHSTLYFENACPLNESIVLHPIALRANSNSKGVVVGGAYDKPDTRLNLLGRYNPNPNQAYYPIKDKNVVIQQNDWLAMRCTFVNNEDRDIYFRNADDDETCNLYIMYYVDGDHILHNKYCISYGPPYYSWSSDPNLPGGHVPSWVNIEASLRNRFDN